MNLFLKRRKKKRRILVCHTVFDFMTDFLQWLASLRARSAHALLLRRNVENKYWPQHLSLLKLKKSHPVSGKVWKVQISLQLLLLHKPNLRHFYKNAVLIRMYFGSYLAFVLLKVLKNFCSRNAIISIPTNI